MCGQSFQVLVATPGRLMAHLKAEAPVFDLHSLRFLVRLVVYYTHQHS